MLACYDKTTGKYLDNEQSWVGEPKWPEGAVVVEAGEQPWLTCLEAGKIVEDAAKIAAKEAEAEAILVERERRAAVETYKLKAALAVAEGDGDAAAADALRAELAALAEKEE